MLFKGKIWKDGRQWLVEVPLLDVMTQGRTKKEALEMIKDAIEELVNRKRFSVRVYPGKHGDFEIGSDSPLIVALLLKRQREMRGLSLAEMVKRLGQKSKTAYARYEQGKSNPTTAKLMELLKAVDPNREFVLSERSH